MEFTPHRCWLLSPAHNTHRIDTAHNTHSIDTALNTYTIDTASKPHTMDTAPQTHTIDTAPNTLLTSHPNLSWRHSCLYLHMKSTKNRYSRTWKRIFSYDIGLSLHPYPYLAIGRQYRSLHVTSKCNSV